MENTMEIHENLYELTSSGPFSQCETLQVNKLNVLLEISSLTAR